MGARKETEETKCSVTLPANVLESLRGLITTTDYL